MWAYRCALRKAGADARLEITKVHKYNYPYDKLYKIYYGKTKLQMLRGALKLPSLLHFDVYQFFSGLSLLRKNKDIPLLKYLNKTIATVFIGGDARCNTRVLNGEISKEECKYQPWCQGKCPLQRKTDLVKYWADNADVILSGPDNSQLLDFYSIPHEILLAPCDTEYWKSFETPYTMDPDEVLILHAPSHRIRKGTNKIISTINNLKDEGHNIKFKLLEDVPNATIRGWTNMADIIIDRVHGCGWYGMGSIQSMSMGKPVISYITQKCKKEAGFDRVPIISVENRTLYDTLVPLIESQKLREEIGKKSRSFAISEHGEEKVGAMMLDLYMRNR